VEAAGLKVHYQASRSNADDDFRLAITLNDVEVGTLSVSETMPASDAANVALPADLLVHDNTLTFELRRNCPAPCKSHGNAASLVIDPASQLNTSGMVLHLPNRLSMLPSPFFDASLQHSIEVPLVFESQPELAELKAAGILASWYGSMAAYRGVHFSVSIGRFPKGNAILLARSDGALAASLNLNENISQVAVCDNPGDRYAKVLALVVRSGGNLTQAVRWFVHKTFSEESDRLAIPADEPTEQDSSLKPVLWSDSSQPLHLARDLNENLMHAKIGSPISLYFRLAPDLNYGAAITAPLKLAFRLSGVSNDDHLLLSIRLNNTYVAKRRLSAADGGGSKTQEFAIPVSILYPSNTLNIELTTNHSDTTVVDPLGVDLQVLPATYLDLRNPSHFVRMPRLDLFAASGYPFTSKADGSETTVILPKVPTSAQIGLFLDAMSFMGSQTGLTASRFNVVDGTRLAEQRDRNFLVIASGNDQTNFHRFEPSMVVIPGEGKLEVGESSLPFREWFSRAWLGRKEDAEALAALLERQQGPKFLMEQFVSPFASDRSVLILATRSENDNQPYFDRLAEASRDGYIFGGVAVDDDARFTSFHLNSGSYVLGGRHSRAAIYEWLQFHLWIMPLFLLGTAMVMAKRWEMLLERQAESRLGARA
jgi:cellulose synthase (UDP-forming)